MHAFNLPAAAEVVAVVYSMPDDQPGTIRVRYADGQSRRANIHGGLYPLAGELAHVLDAVHSAGETLAEDD